MKTPAKFILANLALGLLATGAASALDPQWPVIDSHHGTYTFLARPERSGTTVAFGGHENRNGSTTGAVERTKSSPSAEKLSFRQAFTSHGPVSYFAPAE